MNLWTFVGVTLIGCVILSAVSVVITYILASAIIKLISTEWEEGE